MSRDTVSSNMAKLLTYANFLEEYKIDLWAFPRQRDEQCLLRYRKYLIERRDKGELSATGASHRMRVAVQFYRHLYAVGMIDPLIVLWKEYRYVLSTFDTHGFERTIVVNTTNLTIRNKKRFGLTLEDGLRPLSEDGFKELHRLAQTSMPREFYLMVLLGTHCGMRIGTIANLKTRTLKNATSDPRSPGDMLINVGPGASPPVATKNGVNGQIYIPKAVFERIVEYAASDRRKSREKKASNEDSDLVFLTTNGRPYSSTGSDSSNAIRTLVRNFRLIAKANGNAELSKFKFHQTRATFATRLAEHLLKKHPVNYVLAFVKMAMLHAREATTLIYIRFVQQTPIKIAASDAFTSEFMGDA